MSDNPPNAIPATGVGHGELKRRWQEYVAMTALDLRGLLIEAVSLHEGWEESAIAMVDEAILPVLLRHPTLDRNELVAIFKKFGKDRYWVSPEWDEELADIVRQAFATDTNSPVRIQAGGEYLQTACESLVGKLKAQLIEPNEDGISVQAASYNDGIDTAAAIVRQAFMGGVEKDLIPNPPSTTENKDVDTPEICQDCGRALGWLHYCPAHNPNTGHTGTGGMAGNSSGYLGEQPSHERLLEEIENLTHALHMERGKISYNLDSVTKALLVGISEAKNLFAATPSDFNGELSDDDLVAFILPNIDSVLRTHKPEPVSLEGVLRRLNQTWDASHETWRQAQRDKLKSIFDAAGVPYADK